MRISLICLSCLMLATEPALAASGILVKSRVAGAGELIPAEAVVAPDEELHVAVRPAAGFKLSQIHGCDGQYLDGIFITAKARKSCVILATFVPDPARPVAAGPVAAEVAGTPAMARTQTTTANHSRKSNILKFILVAHRVSHMITVTAGISAGIGSITPVRQTLSKGESAVLLVNPGAGHRVLHVTGCGLNTSNSGVLQTPALSINCHISVSFAALVQGIWDQFNWDQAVWQ